MTSIEPTRLVPLDIFVGEFPLRIDLAYAKADNLLFGEQIYRSDARLWAHIDLAKIVLKASKNVFAQHGLSIIVYDCLRTIDAQERMLQTERVQRNPQWLEEPRLLSPPGFGAHPRAMAIDVSLISKDGTVPEMGTPFDYLAVNGSGPTTNPAHRDYVHLSKEARKNRGILTNAMEDAAAKLGKRLLPLPQEWWDFRFYPAEFEAFSSLRDKDLPPQMRLTDCCAELQPDDFPDKHFQALKEKITAELAL